jgi:hypothetical protein
VTCLFIPGVFLLKFTNDPEALWVPQSASFYDHYFDIANTFGTKYDRDIVFLIKSLYPGEDVLTTSIQRSIVDVHNTVVSDIKGDYLRPILPTLPEPVGYQDLCKPTGGECSDPSYLGIFDYNKTKVPEQKGEVRGGMDEKNESCKHFRTLRPTFLNTFLTQPFALPTLPPPIVSSLGGSTTGCRRARLRKRSLGPGATNRT